jgi:PIN domain nuclease of toxin-antitoxin system
LIVLDTHIWVWWVNGSSSLTPRQSQLLSTNESSGLGVSIISCWEVAKLVEVQRLQLKPDVDQWMDTALRYPGVQLLPLTPEIVIESTRLKNFHRDPADQLIVATARIHKAVSNSKCN